MLRKKKIILIIGLACACLPIAACSSKIENPTEMITVSYEGIPYVGTFSGEYTSKGYPNGEGSLTVDSDNVDFIVNGIWKNGVLNGEAEVALADGSVIYVEYADNLMQGDAKRVYEDGTYALYEYSNGYPKGMVVYCDKEDQIIGIDRYYNNQLIKHWCELATELDYSVAVSSPDSLNMQPVKFAGTVTDMYNTEGSAYIVIENKKNQYVLFTYKNTDADNSKGLVRNIAVGDQITGYGLFNKMDVLDQEEIYHVYTPLQLNDSVFNDKEYLGVTADDVSDMAWENNVLYSSLPVVNMLYADKDENELDYSLMNHEKAAKYDYNDLIQFPYHFTGFRLKDSAKVLQITSNYSSKKAMILLQKSNNEMYYGVYNFSKDKPVPQVGQEINFTAEIDGIYKMIRETVSENKSEYSYVLIPNLVIKKIEI